MRKPLLLALLFAFALPMTANRAEAQFTLIPYVGYNIEDGFGFLVGIGSEFVAPFEMSNLDLSIAPSVEYVFTDAEGFSYIQVNGDVIAKFAPNGSIAPFAGAGLALGIASVGEVGGVDCDDIPGAECSSSDIGLNILGGVTFPGALAIGEPFVNGRLTLIDGSAISILGGIRIPLGAN